MCNVQYQIVLHDETDVMYLNLSILHLLLSLEKGSDYSVAQFRRYAMMFDNSLLEQRIVSIEVSERILSEERCAKYCLDETQFQCQSFT